MHALDRKVYEEHGKEMTEPEHLRYGVPPPAMLTVG